MSKFFIISNRLPVNISKEGEEFTITPSVGGLATGMKSFYKSYDSKWIGWPGLDNSELDVKDKEVITKKLVEEKCAPVFLDKEDMDGYYYGFSNKTIWPLFHYFNQYVEYDENMWEAYERVNEKFAEAALEHINDGDMVWVHDYHLLLLPELIRRERKNVSIGFFLHIPFPSFEVFRLLPWRERILRGMLGSDLLGFHTYDYERHFLSSVRRLLGLETVFNQISVDKRIAKVDAFPMGIDYKKFKDTALKLDKTKNNTAMQKEFADYFAKSQGKKLILSMDRLDYSKGISNRLRAFSKFLAEKPEHHRKVTMICLAVPSRTNVDQYQMLKSEVDELVGGINGKYGTIDWMPIWYLYRSVPFEQIVQLYQHCNIALVTPIRDGMNLIAKEYIACKTDQKGVLILSEVAGASKEMGEAIIVNPNNQNEIVDAIEEALNMPPEDQIQRNQTMQLRLERYNVNRWAEDFIDTLNNVKELQDLHVAKQLTEETKDKLLSDYKKSKNRLLYLDYDGTLVKFHKNPQHCKPDDELNRLLDKIIADKNNRLVIISGRDRDTLENWIGGKELTIIAEHGVWIREPGKDWKIIEPLKSDWKEEVRHILEYYVDRTPGTFIEEKTFSLAWHYRRADPDFGNIRAWELKDEILDLISNRNLELLEGSKVIEIKTAGINKGRAGMKIFNKVKPDFAFSIGDDWTDEFLFEELPDSAYTIKVGLKKTVASFTIDNVEKVRELLKAL